MSEAPPSYDKVTREAPPNPAPGSNDSNHLQVNNNNTGSDLARSTSASSDTGGDPFEGLSPEEQREFADEYRDLPEGWVKCWDPKNKHHYYVEEKTERAIWVHPYDDPDFLQSLPDSHPAHPESQAARERREELERAEERAKRIQARGGGDASGTDTDEEPGMSSRAAMMHDSEQGDKSWFQRQKDKLADKKEKRAQRKAEERKQRAEQEKQIRKQVDEYRKKRAELMQGQYAAQGMGSSSRYAAPSMAYRSPMGMGMGLGPSYGYGYRPMGMGMGYGGYGGYGGGYGGYGRRGMGMGGMGMPLGMGMMGGLGTGMLLGGGLGGFGGGYGGGFGGGDCGGGGDGGGGGGD